MLRQSAATRKATSRHIKRKSTTRGSGIGKEPVTILID